MVIILRRNKKLTYHKDFPLPVAMTTKQSFPSKIFSMTSFWWDRNWRYPKYVCIEEPEINQSKSEKENKNHSDHSLRTGA